MQHKVDLLYKFLFIILRCRQFV